MIRRRAGPSGPASACLREGVRRSVHGMSVPPIGGSSICSAEHGHESRAALRSPSSVKGRGRPVSSRCCGPRLPSPCSRRSPSLTASLCGQGGGHRRQANACRLSWNWRACWLGYDVASCDCSFSLTSSSMSGAQGLTLALSEIGNGGRASSIKIGAPRSGSRAAPRGS